MPTRPFDVPAALYPFEDRWLHHRGANIHYIDHGEGFPVVLCHGNPTWSFLYRDVIGALGPGIRALAMDLPGFGMSDHPEPYSYMPDEHAAWLRAWLDSLGLDRYILVVQDWGGPTGLSAALQRPEQVAGLVIMNTWVGRVSLLGKAFSWALGGPLGWYLNIHRNYFADKVVPSAMYYRKAKPPAVFAAYTAPFPTPASRRGTYVFPRAIRQVDGWMLETRAKLAQVSDRPVELVWGMKDALFGREELIASWQRRFPSARVTRLEKASHYLQEDQPQAIAEAIQRVVAQARG